MGHERDSCGDLSALAALADEARDAARQAAPRPWRLRPPCVLRKRSTSPSVARTPPWRRPRRAWTRPRSRGRPVGRTTLRPAQTLLWLRRCSSTATGRRLPRAHSEARARPPQRAGLLATGFVALRGYAAERVGALELARDAAEETLKACWSPATDARVLGRAAGRLVAVAQGRIDEALAQGEVAAERTVSIRRRRRGGLSPVPIWRPEIPSRRWRRSRSSAGWTRASRRSTGCEPST